MSNHEPTESTQVDESGSSEPSTRAGKSTIRDFEAYVNAVPSSGDFAVDALLVALRRDRQSSLDQIRGAVLAIEAEARAASPKGERASAQAEAPGLDEDGLARALHEHRRHPLSGACPYCRQDAHVFFGIAEVRAYAEADREAGE